MLAFVENLWIQAFRGALFQSKVAERLGLRLSHEALLRIDAEDRHFFPILGEPKFFQQRPEPA